MVIKQLNSATLELLNFLLLVVDDLKVTAVTKVGS